MDYLSLDFGAKFRNKKKGPNKKNSPELAVPWNRGEWYLDSRELELLKEEFHSRLKEYLISELFDQWHREERTSLLIIATFFSDLLRRPRMFSNSGEMRLHIDSICKVLRASKNSFTSKNLPEIDQESVLDDFDKMLFVEKPNIKLMNQLLMQLNTRPTFRSSNDGSAQGFDA